MTINPYLDTDNYPMPNPHDLFATLAGGQYFTRLDMKQAYQQMKIHVDSQKYLTVNTFKGLFAYTRMLLALLQLLPFGSEQWMEF